MRSQIAPSESVFLDFLEDTPYLELLTLCETPDQAQHWISLKGHYLWLRRYLCSYFAGEATGIDARDPKNQMLLGIGQNWISLYNLVSMSWAELEKEFPGIGSPGELMRLLLKTEADLFFWECLPSCPPDFSGYSPANAMKDSSAISKSLSRKKLSKREAGRLSNIQRRMEQRREHEPFRNWEDVWGATLLTLEKVGEASPRVKRELTHYRKDYEDLMAHARRHQHPKNPDSLGGYKWVNGAKVYPRASP